MIDYAFGHWIIYYLRYVMKFRTFCFCLSTSGEVTCFICLINPLEGLLVRSSYSVCIVHLACRL